MSGHPETDWEACRRKGEGFLPWFTSDDAAAAPASPWTALSDLEAYGWRRAPIPDDRAMAEDLGPLFEELGLLYGRRGVRWMHTEDFTNQDGEKGVGGPTHNGSGPRC